MDAEPPGLGASLHRYQLQTRLARGGTGEAFRALTTRDDGTEELVVVRRLMPLHAGSQALTELFLSQARVMTRLDHPNLVRVLDHGVDEDGNYVLVQELVQGLDLARLCRRLWAHDEQLPVPVALHVATQVLHGLAYAHAHETAEGAPLVHRVPVGCVRVGFAVFAVLMAGRLLWEAFGPA